MRFIVVLAIAATLPAAGMARRQLPAASRSLELSVVADTARACAADDGSVRVPVTLTFRNRGTIAVRVLPETVQLAAVQVVRTVEELMSTGTTTAGVTIVPTRARSGKGPARLLPPGASIDVARAIEMAVANPALPGAKGAFTPGHYFLEVVGIAEGAPAGRAGVAAQSTISPYVEVDIPPVPSGPCGPSE